MTEIKKSPYTILFVDDEEKARKYFAKGLGKDFNIITAQSVDEAKKIIEQAVLKNQIDGLLHNCVIVYYQFEGDTALYVLSARRHTHGHLEIWAQERELEDGTWVMDDGGVCF